MWKTLNGNNNHLISARLSDLITINNKKIQEFAAMADHRVKLKKKWEEGWIPRPCKGNLKKKLWNMKVAFIPNFN